MGVGGAMGVGRDMRVGGAMRMGGAVGVGGADYDDHLHVDKVLHNACGVRCLPHTVLLPCVHQSTSDLVQSCCRPHCL